MKILITGSRNIKFKEYIYFILDKEIKNGDFIIQGGAEGVDSIALDWCHQTKKELQGWNTITAIKNNSDYLLHRNAEMVGMCDRVIAFWDGVSRGTDFTIRYAQSRNKLVTIYNPFKEGYIK